MAPTSVLVDGDKIAAIDPAIHTGADAVVEAAGLHLIPGVIDDQVHFREPGLTHKEDLRHASRACAKGGVTTFLEMPNTNPNTTTQRRLEEKLALAAERSLVNFGFYIGATPDNLDELKHAQRTPGIKIFIGSSTGDLLVDDQDALERIFGETSLPICTTVKTSRLCGPTSGATRTRTTSPITRGFAITKRRWSARVVPWTWPFVTSIVFTYCTFRREPKRTWWPITAA